MFQMTALYETVLKEKEDLVGKVATLETETKTVREQLTSERDSAAALAKVCELRERERGC